MGIGQRHDIDGLSDVRIYRKIGNDGVSKRLGIPSI